jgi:hypothetical protein
VTARPKGDGLLGSSVLLANEEAEQLAANNVTQLAVGAGPDEAATPAGRHVRRAWGVDENCTE